MDRQTYCASEITSNLIPFLLTAVMVRVPNLRGTHLISQRDKSWVDGSRINSQESPANSAGFAPGPTPPLALIVTEPSGRWISPGEEVLNRYEAGPDQPYLRLRAFDSREGVVTLFGGYECETTRAGRESRRLRIGQLQALHSQHLRFVAELTWAFLAIVRLAEPVASPTPGCE